MTRISSSTDLAIADALSASAPNGKLRIVPRTTRFGDLCYSVEDDRGTIEVHSTSLEVYDRIDAIKAKGARQ